MPTSWIDMNTLVHKRTRNTIKDTVSILFAILLLLMTLRSAFGLQMVVNQPSTTDYATTSIPINVTTDQHADLCTATENGVGKTLIESVSGGGSNSSGSGGGAYGATYTEELTLDDGVHIVTIRCSAGNESVEENITMHIDTTPPTLTKITPSGNVYETPVTLSVTTDEPTICRYGTEGGSYSTLKNSFSQQGVLTHTASLALAEGAAHYTVACQDPYGNEGVGETSFTLSLKPTAEISVEGENPHKAGTYRVELRVSKPLVKVPDLTLTYQGGGTEHLALTELDETRYEGYLIVPEDSGNKVGSFSFKGETKDGLEGTRITDGELFVVDTTKPPKIETFKAVNDTEGVELDWFYDGEKATFNLYRSTTSGVGYTDYYTSLVGDSYLDTDTNASVRYYYRIAAVDEAGNVGPLSHEEFASQAEALYTAEKVGDLLNPVLQVALEKRMNDLDSKILDADRIISDLTSEKDTEKGAIITTLGLVSKARAALLSLKNARSDLEKLKSEALSKDEFNEKISAIQKRINSALLDLVVDIEVNDKSEFSDISDQNAVNKAVTQLLRNTQLDEKGRASYLEKANALQNSVDVSTTVRKVRITTLDGSKREYTIVNKYLSISKPTDVIAIENILKGVAEQASEITFLDTKPLVLEKDPVVQYNLNSLTEKTLTYLLPKNVDTPAIRGSLLTVLPKPSGALIASSTGNSTAGDGTADKLGGNVIMTSIHTIWSVQWLAVTIGILVISLLIFYYFKISDDDDRFQPRNRRTIIPEKRFFNEISPNSRNGESMILQPSQPSQTLQSFQQFQSSQRQPLSTVLVTRKEDSLADLLMKGHELIDKNDYPDALYFYKKVIERYNPKRFSSSHFQKAVLDELTTLHAKLNLFKTISEAHDAVYLEDSEQLESLMVRLQSLASSVGDNDTTLIEKAKTEYEYLFNRLNQFKSHESFSEFT